MTSCCRGPRVDGCVRHAPGCDFYRPVDMFREHPDLLDVGATFLAIDGEATEEDE